MTETNEIVDNKVVKSSLLEILKLKLAGLTEKQIADKYNITQQAVNKRLKGIFKLLDPDKLQAYKENKIQLLTATESELLSYITQPSKLHKANLSALAMAYGIVYDKNRLESNLSTSNVAVVELTQEQSARYAGIVDDIVKFEVQEVLKGEDGDAPAMPERAENGEQEPEAGSNSGPDMGSKGDNEPK